MRSLTCLYRNRVSAHRQELCVAVEELAVRLAGVASGNVIGAEICRSRRIPAKRMLALARRGPNSLLSMSRLRRAQPGVSPRRRTVPRRLPMGARERCG